jgi:hypothetical protein
MAMQIIALLVGLFAAVYYARPFTDMFMTYSGLANVGSQQIVYAIVYGFMFCLLFNALFIVLGAFSLSNFLINWAILSGIQIMLGGRR